jgi:adenine-specific DNA glycosylase
VKARQRLGFAVVRDRRRLLLQRRPASGLFGGLWAPPAVELPAGRLSAATARRLMGDGLFRALGAEVEVGAELAAVERTLTHRELTLVAYRAWPARRPSGPGLCWAAPSEVEQLGVASAVRALLARLPSPSSGTAP